MAYDFKGKTALVTGATKGIGREIAIELYKSNANVIAVGRSQELLVTPSVDPEVMYSDSMGSDVVNSNAERKNELNVNYSTKYEELKKQYPKIQIINLDISDWKKTEQLLSKVGSIDLLVNNAAMGWLKSLMDVEEDDFDSVFGINVKALINVTKIVIKNLLARKAPGSIVNLSSQASIAGLLNHTVYCGSKGAVDSFTKAVALEYGPQNIRINAVNPTVIMTEMGRAGWSDPKIAEPMIQKIPLRRFGEVEEVVNAVLFLLSEKASMITGVTLPIDGGFTAA